MWSELKIKYQDFLIKYKQSEVQGQDFDFLYHRLRAPKKLKKASIN